MKEHVSSAATQPKICL